MRRPDLFDVLTVAALAACVFAVVIILGAKLWWLP